MDVVFDIDGTIADNTHRLRFIKDMDHWIVANGKVPKPNWDAFMDDGQVAMDAAIPQTWGLMASLLRDGHQIIFITGRPDRQRELTLSWIFDAEHKNLPDKVWYSVQYFRTDISLYMRETGDRRPSHVVKQELLHQARKDGYNPTMAFEDRESDAAMWRAEGLLCCRLAEGTF